MLSRIEALLEALITDSEPPSQPQSRVEAYLYRLCELLGDVSESGGSSAVVNNNSIELTDIKTNKKYKIVVEDGKLTMTEVTE